VCKRTCSFVVSDVQMEVTRLTVGRSPGQGRQLQSPQQPGSPHFISKSAGHSACNVA